MILLVSKRHEQRAFSVTDRDMAALGSTIAYLTDCGWSVTCQDGVGLDIETEDMTAAEISDAVEPRD